MVRSAGLFSWFLSLPLLFFLVVLSSCEDDSVGIGKGILPGTDDYQIFTDQTLEVGGATAASLPVRVNPPKPASLYAETPSFFHHAFGWYQDPVFGEITAQVALPFLMQSVGKNFGEGATVDSLVLYLKYQTRKGDPSDPIGYELYELSEVMGDTVAQYSDFSIEGKFNPTVIQSGVFAPSVSDSFAAIRITNPVLLDKLISLDSVDMINDSTFWSKFKGLYLRPVPLSDNGQMYYLSFFISEMDLFYHNATTDSMFFRFLGYPYATVSSIRRDYVGTPVHAAIAAATPGDFSYIAASAGPVAPFTIPGGGLVSWFDDLTMNQERVVVLNKVEVDLFPATGQSVKDIPRSLLLQTFDDDGQYTNLEYVQAAPYDKDRGCYTFDITVFAQEQLKAYNTGDVELPELVVVAGQNPYTPYQVVIDNRLTKVRTVYSRSR